MDLVDIKAPNVYGKVPIDIIQTLYSHRRSECILLNMIYTKRLAIIQQSFVRRWLAMRKLQRLRLKKALLPIIMAPPKQVGFVAFYHFEGGSEYIKCYEDYKQSLH